MKNTTTTILLALAATIGLLPLSSNAQLKITEVNPNGSARAYAADWFELMNVGTTNLDLTGWKVDDASPSFATAVGLRGITSLAPGQVAVFLEGNASGTTDLTVNSNFVFALFGVTSTPSGMTLANYGGSGIGLSSSGDAVNIYDSIGTLMAGVTFGATTGFTNSLDNAAGLDGTAISQQSAVGVNGAFQSSNLAEVGSPGVVPEPATFALGGLGIAALIIFRRRNS